MSDIRDEVISRSVHGLGSWHRDTIADTLHEETGLPLWHPDVQYLWHGVRAGLWTLVTESPRVPGCDQDANEFQDNAIRGFTTEFAQFCREARGELVFHRITPMAAGYGYAVSRLEEWAGTETYHGREFWTRQLGRVSGMPLRMLIPEAALTVVEGDEEYRLDISGLQSGW